MAERTRPFWVLFLLVVVVLVAGGVGGGWLYYHNHPTPGGGPRVVGLGDNVSVDYVGMFGSGPETGRVFDTSIQSIANNNLTWPKSLEYSYRNSSDFTPLGVHVGPGGGYTLNNTTYGSVVPGFWQGLLGLAGNQSRWVTIPPALGYGAINQSCLVSAPLVAKVPQLIAVPYANFSAQYPGVERGPGNMFVDPTYGWTDLVFSSNDSAVTIEQLPTVGFTSNAPGWPITVTAVSGGNITISNGVSSANVGLLLGHSSQPVCSRTAFIISAVDPANGTFIENFNTEVTGQTLIFRVTVVDIFA
jgi:hypothetical protein